MRVSTNAVVTQSTETMLRAWKWRRACGSLIVAPGTLLAAHIFSVQFVVARIIVISDSARR